MLHNYRNFNKPKKLKRGSAFGIHLSVVNYLHLSTSAKLRNKVEISKDINLFYIFFIDFNNRKFYSRIVFINKFVSHNLNTITVIFNSLTRRSEEHTSELSHQIISY